MIQISRLFHVDRISLKRVQHLHANRQLGLTVSSQFEERSFEMSSILQFIKEEEGAEVVEVGIWLALIVALSIGTIALIGPKVKQAFVDVNTGW
jgi:pilus assembly protein Flp/PilA